MTDRSPVSNTQSPPPMLQRWILAARPKTLPAAAAPVLTGSAAAFSQGEFHILPALAALMAALLLQIGANFANDLFDYRRGADAHNRLGPTRMTQSGLLTPRQMARGMWLVFGLAAVLGIYLAWVAGWAIVIIGVAAILAALAYTGGPFPFGYYGLGDLFVFFFFGPLAVCGTYFVHTRTISILAVSSSVPIGLLITAILVINNLRDIESDHAVGKRTLAVRIGPQGTRWEFLLCLIGAYLSPILIWWGGLAAVWVLLSSLSLPMAYSLIGQVWRESGRPLNLALAAAGRLTLVFSLLFSLGLIVGAF